jgi:hypothetical protein
MYDQIITAIHAHWKVHGNAYPQAILLTECSWRWLNALRRRVNDSMAFTLELGWEHLLHGVPIQRSPDIDAGCRRSASATVARTTQPQH